MITSEMTVNQVLRQYPSALPVFNRYRMDACCGGMAPLAVAGAAAGVAVEELLAVLEAAAGQPA
jgi:regulator of cell morphogenesis and NO signaling